MKLKKKFIAGMTSVMMVGCMAVGAFAATPRYPVDLCPSCMRGAMVPYKDDSISSAWNRPCIHGHDGNDIEEYHFVVEGARCDYCNMDDFIDAYEYVVLVCMAE